LKLEIKFHKFIAHSSSHKNGELLFIAFKRYFI